LFGRAGRDVLGAEVRDFQGGTHPRRRIAELATAAVVRRHEPADHLNAVREIEHDNAARALHRPHLPLWRVEQPGHFHHFVDVGAANRNRRRFEERARLAELRCFANDETFADGPIVVSVREQNRVENFS
jgi:hypothetical protein